MKYLRKKYGLSIDLLDDVIHALTKINELDFNNKIEALLLLNNLNIHYKESETCLEDIVKVNYYDLSLLNLIKRHLVLIQFDRNIDERKAFIQHWISNEHYKKEDIFLQNTLMVTCSEDVQFFNEEDLAKIKKSQKRRIKRTTSTLSLCWLWKSLEHLGISTYHEFLFEKILSKRESNGSWGNSLERTIKIAVPLSMIKHFDKTQLDQSLAYILKRAEQGYEIPLTFKFQFVKLWNNLGGINQELMAYMTKGIQESSKIDFSQIRKNLLQSKFDLVFDQLQNLCANNGMANQFLNLKTRWTKNEQQKHLGLISNEDYQVAYNRIVQSIEYLIQFIESTESEGG